MSNSVYELWQLSELSRQALGNIFNPRLSYLATRWRAVAFCISFRLHSSADYGTRQTKETYGRVKIPFGPINQIISHWFQLPGATLEWPPITSAGGKRYKIPKTMTTHWHNCPLTTWLFIPHYAVAAAKAWTNSFRRQNCNIRENIEKMVNWV